MVKSKTHKFDVDGLVSLLDDICQECNYAYIHCLCEPQFGIRHRPTIPVLTILADDTKWSVQVFRRDGIGIKLEADKIVRADVRLTVFSKDLNVSDVTIEEKNVLLGSHFFQIIDESEYDLEEGVFITEQAHVRNDDTFSVELFIDVLNRNYN